MILRSLARNLRAGLRLALFLPLRPFDYRASPADYVALVAFNFLAWLAAAGVRAGFRGELDAAALFLYFAGVPLILATAFVLAQVYRAPASLLLFAVALTASDLAFEVAGLALPYAAALTGLGPTLFFAFFGWLWLASVRAVAVCGGRRRPQFYRGAAAVSAMLALLIFAFPKLDAWQEPPYTEPAPLADERLFHLQGELIRRSLAQVRPGTPGRQEMYFVGFAPDAREDVFLREMRFVQRLFEERFGTLGRSVTLASSTRALEEFPIATVTNLSRALKRVGEAMNPEEDVLFLYLSAHGDASHRLSASQPPLAPAELTPTALARALQDAGIKWRVIVVSACYSGGYIEPLRDENSILITAAAPDRTSFGCEPGQDFTYFGEAFFRDALSRTSSFVEAFHAARATIMRREADEKLKPSLPQIWVGQGLQTHLGR